MLRTTFIHFNDYQVTAEPRKTGIPTNIMIGITTHSAEKPLKNMLGKVGMRNYLWLATQPHLRASLLEASLRLEQTQRSENHPD